MRLDKEGVRVFLSLLLVIFLAAFAVYLWFVDLLSNQREFGAFLTAELIAFAMLVYISTKPDFDAVKKSWVLMGCIALASILALPFFFSAGLP